MTPSRRTALLPLVPSSLLADLAIELPRAVRLQRLVEALRAQFRCGAVALLALDGDQLRPVAVDGLVSDTLGRRFAVRDHPRLAAILRGQGVICFDNDSQLPDPYDGLIASRVGEPLPVHDCMGLSLTVAGRPWGVVTFDALDIGCFSAAAQAMLASLSDVIAASVRMTELETENQALKDNALSPREAAIPAGEDPEIITRSPAMTRLLHELQIVGQSGLPVLLLGETGVGKELFAHRLHRLSSRADKAMVHVNCAALPESLAESELFGHVRGAFSGAVADRPGRFEAAHGGTLFLDEVGELSLPVQAKLLRTLQNGEIQRLGADRPRRVDVRIIAATNRSLADLVRDGLFRADLYHRLSVYPVPIPPLRERKADILLIAGRFLEQNRARLGLRSLRLSADAEAALQGYSWPGNVREVEHVISRAALKAISRGADRRAIITLEADLMDLEAGAALSPRHGDRAAASTIAEAATAADPAPSSHRTRAGQALQPSLQSVTDEAQRQAIRDALAVSHGNWTAAARQLAVDPSNLHKLARRLGLKPSAQDARR